MNNIFDTHAHYHDKRFDHDRDALLADLPGQGIAFVLECGTDLQSSKQALQLAQQHNHIYAAVGIHPHEAKAFTDTDQLNTLAQQPKCVAIGEIGLDYHYDFSPREAQQQFFRAQLELAQELNMPVVIHDREAHEDTLKLLQAFKPCGVMHCFSGSVEFAREIIKLGLYIGLGGAVTFKNARKALEVAAEIPLDRLLLETDAPYMAPVPHRGQRCDSRHIALVAARIAEIRGMDAQALIDQCAKNAKELFF